MAKAEKIARISACAAATVASLLKVMLRSRRPDRVPGAPQGRGVVILGNGPSLRHTIDTCGERLADYDLMAVNFFATSPDYFTLRPGLYVLADPHFFEADSDDANVRALRDNISRTSWPMTLFLPHGVNTDYLTSALPGNVRIARYNLTPAEGAPCVVHSLYARGLAMPRPRNILVPALMLALRMGYRRIVIVGADHGWTQTLSVDSDNCVVSVQPHFYADRPEELERIKNVYRGVRLHDVLQSLTIAFRSYHAIRAYADSLASAPEIINATPGSFIDAFRRGEL